MSHQPRKSNQQDSQVEAGELPCCQVEAGKLPCCRLAVQGLVTLVPEHHRGRGRPYLLFEIHKLPSFCRYIVWGE
eukprot:3930296-Prymnesium_polylepis.1